MSLMSVIKEALNASASKVTGTCTDPCAEFVDDGTGGNTLVLTADGALAGPGVVGGGGGVGGIGGCALVGGPVGEGKVVG